MICRLTVYLTFDADPIFVPTVQFENGGMGITGHPGQATIMPMRGIKKHSFGHDNL